MDLSPSYTTLLIAGADVTQKTDPLCATTFKSALGWFAVVWNGRAVAELTFGHAMRDAAVAAVAKGRAMVANQDCPDPGLVDRLREYANGGEDDFTDVEVDTSHLTHFGRRVVKACRAIPYGETSSYGALSKQAGSPKAARAVGQCMASNRVPLIIPCHRVVAADGRLGGFSAPGGILVKRRLLDLERKVSDFA